ncbi:MAG TPA: hypothetical protein VME46_08235 [Acidimicrobiales bacterium]|nr:hypothetical protein [Acidimicrobiales bacterium]
MSTEREGEVRGSVPAEECGDRAVAWGLATHKDIVSAIAVDPNVLHPCGKM